MGSNGDNFSKISSRPNLVFKLSHSWQSRIFGREPHDLKILKSQLDSHRRTKTFVEPSGCWTRQQGSTWGRNPGRVLPEDLGVFWHTFVCPFSSELMVQIKQKTGHGVENPLPRSFWCGAVICTSIPLFVKCTAHSAVHTVYSGQTHYKCTMYRTTYWCSTVKCTMGWLRLVGSLKW